MEIQMQDLANIHLDITMGKSRLFSIKILRILKKLPNIHLKDKIKRLYLIYHE